MDPYLLVCNVDVVDRRARKAIPDNGFRSLLSCCPHRRSFYRPVLTDFRAFENSCADFHAVDENHTAARHEKCRGMVSTPPCCRGGRSFTWWALGKHFAVGNQTDSTLTLQYGWSGTIDSGVKAYRWTREFKVGKDSSELVVEQEQGQEQEVANRGNRRTFGFQHVTALKRKRMRLLLINSMITYNRCHNLDETIDVTLTVTVILDQSYNQLLGAVTSLLELIRKCLPTLCAR